MGGAFAQLCKLQRGVYISAGPTAGHLKLFKEKMKKARSGERSGCSSLELTELINKRNSARRVVKKLPRATLWRKLYFGGLAGFFWWLGCYPAAHTFF